MNDVPDPPKVFANRLIRQVVDHSFGSDLLVEPNDYLAIRTTFRSLKGEWQEVLQGSPKHLDILKQVVTAWGQMPDRKRQESEFV